MLVSELMTLRTSGVRGTSGEMVGALAMRAHTMLTLAEMLEIGCRFDRDMEHPSTLKTLAPSKILLVGQAG
jgi:hypothetical protein